MIELKFENYHVVEALFDEKQQHLPALSVLQGNYPGWVFADHETGPALAIVWATGRWMYAAGDAGSAENARKLTAFLQSTVIPDAKERLVKWFEIYTDDSAAWTTLFMPEIAGLKVYRHLESVYEFNRERFDNASASAKEASADGTVTVEYEEFPVLEEQDERLAKIHSRVTGHTTTGAVVRADGRVVSVCKHNGLTVDGKYFIDVDTYAEEERGKGYATLAARSLIRYYLEKGMQPLWETTHENTASHMLALKLGFQPVESYPVFAFVMA